MGERDDASGYVYVTNAVGGLRKIGRTADPKRRLSHLRVESPGVLSFERLVVVEDAFISEKLLHLLHSDKHCHGEWFRLTEDDVAGLAHDLENARQAYLQRRRRLTVDTDKLAKEILAQEERAYPPIHPGEILALEWLEPLGISATELANDLGVPRQRLNEVVRGRRAISADTALRLARWSGMRASFWLGLQSRYDLELAEWKEGSRIEREVQPLAALS
jgi:addiction module HigA family antidote